MTAPRFRWVLAFDGGCAQCRAISRTVQDACRGRLDVLPLNHPEVLAWLEKAKPGSAPVPAPTLLRVGTDTVRVWRGPAMAMRLVRHLGVRTALRVVQALGAAPNEPSPGTTSDGPGGTTRRRFLELGAGGFLAAGILITGAIPASADPIAAWLKNHRDQLPRTYQALSALPPEYRSAVYAELTPEERSAAWVAHLQAAGLLLSLNPEQAAVLEQALVMAADPANFVDGQPPAPGADSLSQQSIDLFDIATARAVFATLGPDDGLAGRFANCECSTSSDYCGNVCRSGGCTILSSGCGFLYQYACNGRCV